VKRDWDLIRQLLIAVESACDGGNAVNQAEFEVSDHSAAAIGYHVALLHEAGLISAIDVSSHQSEHPEFLVERLTWEGHDFLDAARDDTRWNRVKGAFAKAGKGIAFAVLKAALDAAMKAAVMAYLTGPGGSGSGSGVEV
jgi:hypothetical protein